MILPNVARVIRDGLINNAGSVEAEFRADSCIDLSHFVIVYDLAL